MSPHYDFLCVCLGSANKPTPSTPSIRELGSLKLSGQYQWYKLGLQLGMEQHVLERIEETYRDSEIRQYKMFGGWLKRDTEASWYKLCAALQIVGGHKLVKQIASQHGMLHSRTLFACYSLAHC